jgi:hypothetical protein
MWSAHYIHEYPSYKRGGILCLLLKSGREIMKCIGQQFRSGLFPKRWPPLLGAPYFEAWGSCKAQPFSGNIGMLLHACLIVWRALWKNLDARCMRAEYSKHATVCVLQLHCENSGSACHLHIRVRYLPLLRSSYKNLPLCLIIYICLSSWYCLPHALRWVKPIGRGNTGNVGLTSIIVSS